MSLNLTIVGPFGIWQSSDHRLVNTTTMRLEDDEASKSVHLHCRDGTALTAFAGVGRLNGVCISDWIRETLRGENQTVDECLILLRENATRDLGPWLRGRRLHHMFTVAAVIGGRPWVAQIRNFETFQDRHGVSRDFRTVTEPVTLGGAFCFPPLVSDSDAQILIRAATRRPRDPTQFSELLAAVDRRVSSGLARRIVSPHCVTAYVPPVGQPVSLRFHDASGESRTIITPILLFGVDMTELFPMVGSHTPRIVSPSTDGPDAAVTPRNRLRRR